MLKLKAYSIALLAVFLPIKAAAITVLVLVLADFITGVIAARKRGEQITSTKMRNSVAKLLVFQALLLLGFLTETYLTGDAFPVTKIISGFIGATELLSIAENLNSASGGTLLSGLLSKLGKPNS